MARQRVELNHWLGYIVPSLQAGRLWRETAALCFMIAVQTGLVPVVAGSLYLVDLVTPWLIICFVRLPVWSNIWLVVVAASGLEVQSSVPAGFHLCSIAMIGSVVMYLRANLSWRHIIPWLVTFLLAQLWVVAFELFVLQFVFRSVMNAAEVALTVFTRLLVSTLLGMLILGRSNAITDSEHAVS